MKRRDQVLRISFNRKVPGSAVIFFFFGEFLSPFMQLAGYHLELGFNCYLPHPRPIIQSINILSITAMFNSSPD